MDQGTGQVDTTATELDVVGLNTALSEATCLGIEVDATDARLRICLETLSLPEGGEPINDRRIDLTLTGISRIAASLRFHWWTLVEANPKATVLPLTLEGLDEAVKSFGGAALHGWEFVDIDDSSWKKWGELLSFDTKLGADDDPEAPHILEFTQTEGSNNRELDVRVWFTGITVQTPEGEVLSVSEFLGDARRWWTAHQAGDPRTNTVWHVSPPL